MSLVGRCVLKVAFGSSALKLVHLPSLWPAVTAQPPLVLGRPSPSGLACVCEEPHLVQASQEGPDHAPLRAQHKGGETEEQSNPQLLLRSTSRKNGKEL